MANTINNPGRYLIRIYWAVCVCRNKFIKLIQNNKALFLRVFFYAYFLEVIENAFKKVTNFTAAVKNTLISVKIFT